MDFNNFIWVSQNGVGQILSNFSNADGLFTDSVSVCHVVIIIENFNPNKRITLLHLDNCSDVEAIIKKSIHNVNNTTVIHAYNSIIQESRSDRVDINQYEQTEQRCLNALYEAGVRQIKNIEIPDGAIAVSKNGDVFHINQKSMNRKTAICNSQKMLIGIRPVSFFELQTSSDLDKDVDYNKNYSSGYFFDSYLRPMRFISFANSDYSENLKAEKALSVRYGRTDFPTPEAVALEDIESVNINLAPVPSSVLYNDFTECFRYLK
jgi:hypothetical protein